MTVDDWRMKRWNRRCKFCTHLGLRDSVLGYCIAKRKIVEVELLRPFCRLFELRKEK